MKEILITLNSYGSLLTFLLGVIAYCQWKQDYKQREKQNKEDREAREKEIREEREAKQKQNKEDREAREKEIREEREIREKENRKEFLVGTITDKDMPLTMRQAAAVEYIDTGYNGVTKSYIVQNKLYVKNPETKIN